MNLFLHLITSGAAVVAAALTWHWTDRFHYVFGALLAVPLLLLLRLLRRSQRTSDGRRVPYRPAKSLVAAALAVGYFAAGFELIRLTPLGDWTDDADRAVLTAELDTLVARGDYAAATDRIATRVSDDAAAAWPTLSPAFRHELIVRRYELLTDWGKSLADPHEARQRYADAAGWAREHGLNGDRAASLDALAARQTELDDLVDRCRAVRDWPTAAETLRTALRTAADGSGERRARQLCDVLIDWARETTDLAQRRALLAEAAEVAAAAGLDEKSVVVLLADVEEDFAERAQIERRLDALREAESWQELRALLTLLIEQRAANDWTRDYRRAYVDALCAEAETAPDDRALSLLAEAEGYAARANLPTQTIQAQHEALRLRIDARQQADALVRRDADSARCIAERLEALAAGDDTAALVHALDMLLSLTPEAAAAPYVERLQQALVAHCDRPGDAGARRERAAAAVKIARCRELDAAPFVERLAQADRELAEQRRLAAPIEIPVGTTASIQRLVPGRLTSLDFTLNLQGVPLEGVAEKDVRLTLDGRPVTRFVLTRVSEHEQLQCFVALDTSPSMSGAAQQALAAGVKDALTWWRGRDDIELRFASASDPGRMLSDWMQPSSSAGFDFSRVELKNNTALFATLDELVAQLASRTGLRRLIVVSDGGNNVPGAAPETFIARAVELGVVIDAVGIRSATLDAEALRRAAIATGGTYVEAADASRIAEQFGAVTRRIDRDFYRLVAVVDSAPTAAGGEGLLELRIGGERAVNLSARLPRGRDEAAARLSSR